MKRITLALTAAVALTFATPVLANHAHGNSSQGSGNSAQASGGNSGSQNNNSYGSNNGLSAAEVRALQIRRECEMFAFRYWRFHPDYQHCRNY